MDSMARDLRHPYIPSATVLGDNLYMWNTHNTVGGTVSEFMVGEDGVLSWSPPVPPNGVILHYNVIITRADTGELVRRVDVFEGLSIDLTAYGGEIGMDYNVTVSKKSRILLWEEFSSFHTQNSDSTIQLFPLQCMRIARHLSVFP